MNGERSFERFVADHVADNAGIPMSDDFYDDMHTFASGTRQRPEWLALIKEPPMRTNARLAVGSPTARVAAITVATLLLALTVVAAGIAGQRLLAADGTIVVAQDGSGHYTTINEAVAAATDGDEILVKPGTYAESVVIDKDIALLGEVRDGVIIEFGAGCVFDEETEEQTCPSDTPLVHLESPSGMFSEDAPFGIQLIRTNAQVRHLTMHDQAIDSTGETSSYSIVAFGGAPVIHEVTLTRPDDAGGHVHIQDGSGATISDSELGSLQVEYESPVTVIRNVIQGQANINIENTASVGGEALVKDNTIGWMSIGGPVTVEGNEFPASLASSQEGPIGIFVERGGGYVLRDNVIEGRQTGIQAHPDGVLEDNILEGNGVGLYHVGDPPAMSGNRICDNSFRNVRADRSNAEIDLTMNEICPDE